MDVVGILGGVGSGKSTVANMLVELCNETGRKDRRPPRRAGVVDADRLAHEVLERPAIQRELRALFGADVVTPEGRVDRRAIAERVFANADLLGRLEALVHPPVREAIRGELDRARRATGPAPARDLLVLDVPLLAESPLADECDELLFVEADRATREARVSRTRGWSAADLRERERRQLPIAEKRRRATRVIDNSGDEDATRATLADWLEARRQRSAAAPGEAPRGPERNNRTQPR